jgi:hypothetical protein
MKPLILAVAILGVVFAPAAADAKGCIKGAIVGGVAGHVAGHGKLGAVAAVSLAITKPISETRRGTIKGRLLHLGTIAFRTDPEADMRRRSVIV